jgi:CheY-like chemotaxis protein
VLSDLIEAAARAGHPERAAGPLERLAEVARASGTDWVLGVDARSRALFSEGETAESLYREAIERFARTRVRVSLARAHLVYGEWLRRENRRVDARELVLLDVRMPGIDGIDVARRVRLRHPETLVVLISIEDPIDLPSVAQLGQAVRLARKQDFGPRLLRQLWGERGRR